MSGRGQGELNAGRRVLFEEEALRPRETLAQRAARQVPSSPARSLPLSLSSHTHTHTHLISRWCCGD
eukprot:3777273-Rhodomonas_salina.1